MNTKAVIAALVIAGAGYHFWSQHQEANQQQAILDSADASGFVELPPTQGVDPNSVLILAAPNCPKAGAQRAAALADALYQRGIPYVQSGHSEFDITPQTRYDKHQLDAVMMGPTPVVLIRGRAKANPSLEEVLAEYNGAGEV